MRVFVYDGREFPDPDPSLSVDEVRQNMANFFPELSNAEVKESKRGEDDIIEFKRRVGVKGHVGSYEIKEVRAQVIEAKTTVELLQRIMEWAANRNICLLVIKFHIADDHEVATIIYEPME